MFKKMFSPRGELDRIEYLIYGVIVPFLLLIIGGIAAGALHKSAPETGVALYIVMLFLSLYVAFIAAVKRANQTNSSAYLIMFLWIFLTPVAVIYLLFAPAKPKSEGESNKKGVNAVVILVAIFGMIVLLGIVSALVLPKLASVKRDANLTHSHLQSAPTSLPDSTRR